MYKAPNLPSASAGIHEITDFIEIECIKKGKVSVREILTGLDLPGEHIYDDGVPGDDLLEPMLDDALNEINRRFDSCGKRYPFRVKKQGHVVTVGSTVQDMIREVYTFLLFATRLDMKNQRTQKDIDGSLLFEELSQYVGKHYFGERSDSFLFGTASMGIPFDEKIKSLIKRMGEGGRFGNRNRTSPNMNKDDGLDVVVWKSFSDGSCGQLIGFGQCKTGTHWKDGLKKLRPDTFCKKWFADQPVVDPVRLFFISESVLRSSWYEYTAEA
ncbi:MAG: hypothetical protein GY757_10545, partial [bacterium]|nr:hypothetical protein [bacterium]